MDRQRIHIDEYGWVIDCFYSYVEPDVDTIIQELREAGCEGNDLYEAIDTLTSDQPNQGFTYSNNRSRRTIVVIGHTDSIPEFFNTWNHEKEHVVKHIVKANDVDPYSEEAAYLNGFISQRMFHVVSDYLCKCTGEYA